VSRQFDWERANKRDRQRIETLRTESRKIRERRRTTLASRQESISDFVHRHQLKCFVCGAEQAQWAKSGISKRGPWAICAACVAERT